MMSADSESPARARIEVLARHLANPQPAHVGSVHPTDCRGPAYARPIALETRFARPAGDNRSVNEAQSLRLTQTRIRGPAYQPTRPGAFSSYEKRASAAPKFARPCESDKPVEIVTQQDGKPRLEIAECKAGYSMEMALPGVSANEVRLELQGNDIVIIGSRAMSGKRLGSVNGLPSGMFRTSTRMPRGIDIATVRAELINGLLRIKARKQA